MYTAGTKLSIYLVLLPAFANQYSEKTKQNKKKQKTNKQKKKKKKKTNKKKKMAIKQFTNMCLKCFIMICVTVL